RRPGVRQRLTFDAGQGHDLPRLGGKRSCQLPACRRPPGAGGHAVPRGAAAELLEQAVARACQRGGPCWEARGARGLALVAEAAGETERAIAMLAEARARSGRLAEPYLWLDGYILDAQCDLGRRHNHPETAAWVEALRTLASRSGMRELTLRSLQHGAALGRPGDSTAAAVLADELAENR